MDTTEMIHNALEWANKRLELQGEPITENQRNYIVFALRQQLTIPAVSGSYFEKMEQLQKDLKEAEIKYVWGKDIYEQNKANLDMMTILNKIHKLKGID